jgi:predicted RNA-binding protein (virulence factor B family)
MNQGTQGYRLTNKTKGRKYCETVPLKYFDENKEKEENINFFIYEVLWKQNGEMEYLSRSNIL